MLNKMRVFARYVLARNLKSTVQWVPSECDNSDEPSRRCDLFFPSVSHLLTHEFDRAGHSEKVCGDWDTDENDDRTTAGHVTALWQSSNFDTDLQQNHRERERDKP